MTTFTLPISNGSAVKTSAPGGGGKIIQRIRRATGSNQSKACCMADADEDLVLQKSKWRAGGF